MMSENAKTLAHLIMEDSKSPVFNLHNDGVEYWINMMSSYIGDPISNASNLSWDGVILNMQGNVSFYDREGKKDVKENKAFCYDMVDIAENEIQWNDHFPADVESFKLTHEEAREIRAILSL